MSDLPYIERVKIQSEILLPLYKRLRKELGEDKANEIKRKARNSVQDVKNMVSRDILECMEEKL